MQFCHTEQLVMGRQLCRSLPMAVPSTVLTFTLTISLALEIRNATSTMAAASLTV